MRLTAYFNTYPDFIVIGAQKSGTTSLYHYLSQHKQVHMSRKKETHYYDYNYMKGAIWYKSFFPLRPNKTALLGEATPEYFFHPSTPIRLHRDNSNAKLILLLRHPVQRSISHFNHNKKKHKGNREELRQFEQAVQAESHRTGIVDYRLSEERDISYNEWHYSYMQKSDYVTQLKHWLKYFNQRQFLVLKSEDLFSNPSASLKEVYEFLNIDIEFPANLQPKNVNAFYKQNLDCSNDFRAYLEKFVEEQNRGLKELGFKIAWES